MDPTPHDNASPVLTPVFCDWETLRRLLFDSVSFVVITHVRPDGDAYGSALALGLSLRALGKKVRIMDEDGLNPVYNFLPGADALEKTQKTPPSQKTVVIAIDVSTQDRLGATFLEWNRKPDINIDHHASNTCFGILNCLDVNAPATAQFLYQIITRLNLPITPAIAQNLFVGLSTDTGSFCYRNTTTETFETAAALTRLGADPAAIAQACYQNYPLSRLLLLRGILDDLKFAFDHRVAYYHLSEELFRATGSRSSETEGLIEFVQMIKTIEVAFVLETTSQSTTRVSLRSRGDVNVQEIAERFGGGGHRLAAGILTRLPREQLEKELLDAIAARLPK